MTLLHMDNFTIYGGNAAFMLNGVYAETPSVSLVADPDGVSAGNVVRFGVANANSTRGFRHVLPASDTKIGMCCRVWMPTLPNGSDGSNFPFQWRNVGNGAIASVTVENTGRLSLRAGSSLGAVLAQTASPVIGATGWYHLEALLDTVTGDFELRVEGVPVIVYSGVFVGPIAQVYCGLTTTNTSDGHAYNFKDFVVYNGGGTYNNTFLGSVIVTNLLPAADVAMPWLSTGPNGFSVLDNMPPVDASYISAINPPPAPYVCELSNLPSDVTSVKGVMTMVRAAKTDGGDGSLQIGIISDSAGTPSTDLGADRPITIAQTYWRDVFEEDPDTNAPFLPLAVDNLQLQIDRTL